jgi:phage tail protein X
MTSTIHFLATLRNVLALSLCSFLILLTCTPFAVATPSTPLRRTAGAQHQSTGPHREGELLVRFRAGVPQLVKDTLMANHGLSKKGQLRGESTIEKFPVTSALCHTARLAP